MKKPIAAQQARSRESLARLLLAAAAVLEEEGLEGATIPRISAGAGLTPGAVYRRFPDKDALLQTLMLNLWEQSDAGMAILLRTEAAAQSTLAKSLHVLLEKTVKSYRSHSRLLTALAQYYRGHPDTGFKKKVDVIETRSLLRVVTHLLLFRKEIHHPHPERAIAFAFTVAGHSMREIMLMETMTDVYAPFLPASDEQLVQELKSMMLAYLRAPGSPCRGAKRKKADRAH